MPVLLLATLWGFAEATLFFIVPDVLLTLVSLRKGIKAACIASVLAVFGAVVGGWLMYGWGLRSEQEALEMLDVIPAIGPDMIATVRVHLQEHGVWSLFLGTANGIPYKIYAVQAPAQEIPLLTFLLVSIPARLYRFLIVSLLAAGVGRLTRQWSVKSRYGMFTAFWVLLYAFYFYNFAD